jgi:uncharacterized protein YdhG (YjbR/CyaY superfamily)
MAKTDLKSVDEYSASQPEAVQGILGHLRGAIRKSAPEAQEVISYKMPTYMLHGCRLLYFAAWKQQYSIYAATAQVVASFQPELASYEIDKGTIRFPLSEPVPVKLIGRITRLRAKEVAEREKAKAAVRKPVNEENPLLCCSPGVAYSRPQPPNFQRTPTVAYTP